MYADDGAIVAESAEDLQIMLNALHEYCCRWHMLVNVDKTEIVVFHDTFSEFDDFDFVYHGARIKVVKTFKYLGVYFERGGVHSRMFEHRVEQGKRVLGAWRRRSSTWSFVAKMRER